MNASRLGRGRGGRLALYGGILMIFVIIIYLYRTASSEMARLHDLHVQCVHQQEALAAQLQVIYEYKVRLEKSLQEEKNSNQALKQELQQRASREKSLRDKDKDNVEILQRYNAMQQKYNILQSENKDLQDECNKRHKLSLEETNKLEVTLRNLRSEINKAHEDKKQSMESLKNKHAQLKVEYDSLWNKNEKLLKNSTECNSQLLHLEKKVFQLNREGEAKKTVVSEYNGDAIADNQQETDHEKSRGNEQVMRPVQPSSSQQVSRPNNDDENPQPLPAPQQHQQQQQQQSNDDNNLDKNDGVLPNEQISDIAFAQKDGNIVPVGRNDPDLKEQQNMVLPVPYNDDNSKRIDKENEIEGIESPIIHNNNNNNNKNKLKLIENNSVLKMPNEKSSSKGPKLAPIQPQRNNDKEIQSSPIEKYKKNNNDESPREVDELQYLNDRVVLGLFSHKL